MFGMELTVILDGQEKINNFFSKRRMKNVAFFYLLFSLYIGKIDVCF